MLVQVTTSSQRDQDDENILIVDSESDEEMPDDGPVEPDDAIQFEDEGDNVEAFEEAQGIIFNSHFSQFDFIKVFFVIKIKLKLNATIAGESTDMYAETLQSDNNEVDVDDSSEPNQSNPNASTSSVVIVPSDDDQVDAPNVSQPQETQQIQAISASDSGSSGPSTPWRGQTGQAASRQQQVTF